MAALGRNNWRIVAVIVGVAASITITTTILREDATTDAIAFTITDTQLNADVGAVDTSTVDAENLTTGEVETGITITETGNDTSEFTGTLDATTGACPGTDDDGTMCISEGDTVQLCYFDAGPEPVERCDNIVVEGAANDAGVLTMNPADIAPGDDTIVLQVTDADLDTTGSPDTTTVDVDNGTTSENETLTLTETGNNTGIFTNSALTTTDAAGAGTDDDGDMNVQDGDTLTATYTDAAPAGSRTATTTVTTPAGVGPTGSWPYTLVACNNTPTVTWGCTEPAAGGVTDCDDADVDGIPDSAAATHYWYDPLGDGSTTDPNGASLGDQLDAAFEAADGSTLGLIGRGAASPYVMIDATQTATEKQAYVSAGITGSIEVCGIEEVAYLKSDTTHSKYKIILGTSHHDVYYKNAKFEGISLEYGAHEDFTRLDFDNIWVGEQTGECPLWAMSRRQTPGQETELVAMHPPDVGMQDASSGQGGRGSMDPINNQYLRYNDTTYYDCDATHQHHPIYYNGKSCVLDINNSQFFGYGNSEANRWLCRVQVVRNSLFQNALAWPPTGVGGGTFVNDYPSGATVVHDSNIYRIGSNAGANRGAGNARSRRGVTGASMPNQYPGNDFADDDYAGNMNYSEFNGATCFQDNCWYDGPTVPSDFIAALTAPGCDVGVSNCDSSDDEWLHNGKIWDRSYWTSITDEPWRPDQRVLTASGGWTGCDLGDVITSSGASGYVWKTDGNDLHVLLGTGYMKSEYVGVDFATGAASGDGCSGTVTTVTKTTAEQLATNENLYVFYYSNSLFEAFCASGPGTCTATRPFFSHGSIPGSGTSTQGGQNRYLILPLDTDADQHGGDGYDTAATPGDGWVERSLFISINNDFVGDWTQEGGKLELIPTEKPIVTYSDGTFTIDMYAQDGNVGPTSHSTTPAGAITNLATASMPTFALELGGSLETPLSMPSWWPTGTFAQICNTLQLRYGDNPSDPDDEFWWDEPILVSALSITSGFPDCP